jgi:hypothetical protein
MWVVFPSPTGEGALRSRADEGESLTVVVLPHPFGFADHLLPWEKGADKT